MKTAIFTGAGASKAVGYPLTSEILPAIREDILKRTLFQDINKPAENAADREQLHGYLRTMLGGFDTCPAGELPMITDVFSLVDYSLSVGESLPFGDEQALRSFRFLLVQGIVDVLLGRYVYRKKTTKTSEEEQWTLGAFVQWIRAQASSRGSNQRNKVGVVTTNYDIELERALYTWVRKEIHDLDLGFDWRDAFTNLERRRPASPLLRMYKLHGSLDTLRCARCGYVYFNPYGSIVHQALKRPPLTENNTCVCNEEERLQVHIVSPSFVREIRDANLLSVWRSALEFLRTADRWYIIGYSLPAEDLAIRSLLIRAYAARVKPPTVTVVQWSNDEEARFKLLFPNCTYIAGGLTRFLEAQVGRRAEQPRQV
ncbi:MAG: hypothetical protein HY962_08260 [Ignavibacteriae bacterium]|nr:hypothetical protein [Ignavibacteriota bacterium]